MSFRRLNARLLRRWIRGSAIHDGRNRAGPPTGASSISTRGAEPSTVTCNPNPPAPPPRRPPFRCEEEPIRGLTLGDLGDVVERDRSDADAVVEPRARR